MSVTLVWKWNIYTHVEDSGTFKGAKPPPAPFLSVRLYYWTPVKTSNTAKYGKECNFATSVWYSNAKKFRIQGAVSPWLPLQARGPHLPSGLPSFIPGRSAAGCVLCRPISDTEPGQREWVSEWVSSFLTAHQHIIGHSVPEMVDSNRRSM